MNSINYTLPPIFFSLQVFSNCGSLPARQVVTTLCGGKHFMHLNLDAFLISEESSADLGCWCLNKLKNFGAEH